MWHSIVIKWRGQSMQEATGNPNQMLGSFDGSVYGDRQAKKMAKKLGREYIRSGGPGQPRYVKSPLEPYGEEEMRQVEEALKHVPGGDETAEGLRDMFGLQRKLEEQAYPEEEGSDEEGGEVAMGFWSKRKRGYAAAAKVETWRPRAQELHRNNPEVYEEILAEARHDPAAASAAAKDPDAYVALWLESLDRMEREGRLS
jgi:hypothetical protein